MQPEPERVQPVGGLLQPVGGRPGGLQLQPELVQPVGGLLERVAGAVLIACPVIRVERLQEYSDQQDRCGSVSEYLAKYQFLTGFRYPQ